MQGGNHTHNWPIILLGILIGLILVKDQHSFKLTLTRISKPTTAGGRGTRPRIVDLVKPPPNFRSHERWRHLTFEHARSSDRKITGEPVRPRPFTRRCSVRRRQNAKILRGRWRESIAKLCKLSDTNLSLAKRHLDDGNFKETIEAAATSVENIARALIHCYGEKPDVDSGQEEVLRLLARRFHGAEKEIFERVVMEVAHIHNNRTVLKHLSADNIETQIFNREKAEQILESASRVSKQFKQTMDDRFATEIPELRDVCPKCHSHNFNTSEHRSGAATCQCSSCFHTWKLPPPQ